MTLSLVGLGGDDLLPVIKTGRYSCSSDGFEDASVPHKVPVQVAKSISEHALALVGKHKLCRVEDGLGLQRCVAG